jgi:two-component system, chemotaxis family, chemotaxis protein CheY
MRSLVVEDTRVVQMILEKLLEPYGECQVAKNGAEAIDAFHQAYGEKRPFDLVCLDMGLPDLDGREVLSKLRAFEEARGVQTDQKVSVIAITAASDTATVRSVVEMGNGYIVKPISREKLVENLVRLGLIPPTQAITES